MRRFLTVLLAAGAALTMGIAPARAHNVLTGSDPKDGAQLTSLPGRATLTFDQPVRPDFAQVALTGPRGAVSALTVRVADNKVTATLPAATEAGPYTLGYLIVSNDGHPVTGKIGFTVTGPAGQAPPSAPPTSPGPGAYPVPSPEPVRVIAATPASSGGSWVWGLLVIALLLSGLGILVVARQGRQAGGNGA